MATFARASPQGPVRIEVEDLVFPEWAGPLSATTIDLKLEALLVTDLDGPGVPVPTSPNFDVQETTQRPEAPDAASRVSPAASQK